MKAGQSRFQQLYARISWLPLLAGAVALVLLVLARAQGEEKNCALNLEEQFRAALLLKNAEWQLRLVGIEGLQDPYIDPRFVTDMAFASVSSRPMPLSDATVPRQKGCSRVYIPGEGMFRILESRGRTLVLESAEPRTGAGAAEKISYTRVSPREFLVSRIAEYSLPHPCPEGDVVRFTMKRSWHLSLGAVGELRWAGTSKAALDLVESGMNRLVQARELGACASAKKIAREEQRLASLETSRQAL